MTADDTLVISIIVVVFRSNTATCFLSKGAVVHGSFIDLARHHSTASKRTCSPRTVPYMLNASRNKPFYCDHGKRYLLLSFPFNKENANIQRISVATFVGVYGTSQIIFQTTHVQCNPVGKKKI